MATGYASPPPPRPVRQPADAATVSGRELMLQVKPLHAYENHETSPLPSSSAEPTLSPAQTSSSQQDHTQTTSTTTPTKSVSFVDDEINQRD